MIILEKPAVVRESNKNLNGWVKPNVYSNLNILKKYTRKSHEFV